MFAVQSNDGSPVDAVYAGGEWRLLASRPTPRKMRATFPPFGGTNPTIPRSQWKAVTRLRSSIPILDQGNLGSCVGHGATTALMLARDIQGLAFKLLSPCFVYANIDGGVDNGAIPGDAAKFLLSSGTCLMTTVPEGIWKPSQLPAGAAQEAVRFKASEIYSCANFDEVVSAFLLGFSVFDTIMCGSNFSNLDSEGVPPVAFGPGNHCVAIGDSLKQRSSGEWLLEHRNSWSTSWGLGGRYFQSESHCSRQGSDYEAWAIKSVLDDPQDSTNLPVPS